MALHLSADMSFPDNEMASCNIRPARMTDAPAIAALISQLGYPSSFEEMVVRLESILKDPEHITLVAEVSGSVVGLVGARLCRALEFNGRYARLAGLVVDETWQGKRIGRNLMEHIEAWERDQGASTLTLTSGSHRFGAHEFYRVLGYQETGLRFAKRLKKSISPDI